MITGSTKAGSFSSTLKLGEYNGKPQLTAYGLKAGDTGVNLVLAKADLVEIAGMLQDGGTISLTAFVSKFSGKPEGEKTPKSRK